MKPVIFLAVVALVASAPAAASSINDITAVLQNQNTARLSPAGRAGDAYSSYWVIRDRKGKAIGDMLQACRWVTAGLRLCVGQLTMPKGTLATIGASRTALLGQFSIVGGTGFYHGAQGVLLFTAVSSRRYVLQATYEQSGG